MSPILSRAGFSFGFGKRKVSSIPPVEISFTASNYNPAANVTSTLSWSVLNSTSVSINQGIGSVAASGSNGQSSSNQTKTFILTAIGLDGITYTSSLSITWAAPPVQITFTSTGYVQANQAAYLYWTVLNSTSVSINQGIGSVASSGLNGPLFATGVTRTYILTAIGLDTLTYTSSVSITWNQRQDD